MSANARHRRTASQGRWKGWNREAEQPPVTIRRVEPTRPAEPMTEPQERHLRWLCEQAGVPFNPAWTKNAARRRIRQLRRQQLRLR
jgi:hypothetical protein